MTHPKGVSLLWVSCLLQQWSSCVQFSLYFFQYPVQCLYILPTVFLRLHDKEK